MTVQTDFLERCKALNLHDGKLSDWLDEIESLRQQLAAALAACKLKDEALASQLENIYDKECHAFKRISAALAIQPDDSALKALLGEYACEAIAKSGAPARWWWSDYGLSLPVGTKLYTPKELK